MKLLCVPISLALFLVVAGPARGQNSSALGDELRRDLADFRGGQFTSVASPAFGQNDLRRDLSDFRPTANPLAGTQPNFQGFDPAQLRQRLDDLRSSFAPNQNGQNSPLSQFRDRDDRWRHDDRWDGRRGDHDYDRDHHHAWHHDYDHDGWHHGDHHDWDDHHHGWRDDYARHHDRDWDHRHHDDHQWAHHDWRNDRDHHDWRRDHDRWDWARHDDRWQGADGRRDNGRHTGWDPDHHKASWQDNGWRARGFTSPPGQQRGGGDDRPRGSVTSSNFTDSKPHSSGNRPSWSGGGSRKGSGGGKSKGR